MQKSFITQYMIIGLSLFSLSLSGMRPDGQLTEIKKANHTIMVSPLGGYFEVTTENKPLLQNYFNTFDIILNDSMDKVICIQTTNSTKSKSKKTPPINDIPHILPLELFILQQKNITKITTKDLIEYKSSGPRADSFFKSHAKLFNSNNTNENSAAQTVQKNLNSIPELNFLVQKQENIESKKILIKNELGVLSNVIVTFSKYPDQIQKTEGKISFTIPKDIDDKTTEIVFNSLDVCLLINTDNLEQEIITLYTTNLKDALKKLSYEDLMQAQALCNYLEIVEEYKGKEIILPSLLQTTFVEKLIDEPYENRDEIINRLDQESVQAILEIIISTRGQDLQKQLEDEYYKLKQSANTIKEHFTVDNIITVAIMWIMPVVENRLCTGLSLSQVLLINDILKNKVAPEFATSANVSPLVKMVFDACDELKKVIANNERIAEEGKRHREKHAAQQEEIKKAEQIEFNRPINRFKRFITQDKSKLLKLGALVTYVTFFVYYADAIENHLMSLKSSISSFIFKH